MHKLAKANNLLFKHKFNQIVTFFFFQSLGKNMKSDLSKIKKKNYEHIFFIASFML